MKEPAPLGTDEVRAVGGRSTVPGWNAPACGVWTETIGVQTPLASVGSAHRHLAPDIRWRHLGQVGPGRTAIEVSGIRRPIRLQYAEFAGSLQLSVATTLLAAGM